MDYDQYEQTLRARAQRQALHRFCATRTLEDDDHCGCSVPPSIDRADGYR